MHTKLADFGYKLGDLVTFSSDKESTGGVIFEIAVNFDSPVPDNERYTFRGETAAKYKIGKRALRPMEVMGYLRLKPVFSFFPTKLGQKPKGADNTLLLHHYAADIQRMHKVDLINLGTKYAELGNLLRDMARMGAQASQED